jgi:hypothetical protein
MCKSLVVVVLSPNSITLAFSPSPLCSTYHCNRRSLLARGCPRHQRQHHVEQATALRRPDDGPRALCACLQRSVEAVTRLCVVEVAAERWQVPVCC